MYPVPSFNVSTPTPDSFDNGVNTEYTVDKETPVNQVYLCKSVKRSSKQ